MYLWEPEFFARINDNGRDKQFQMRRINIDEDETGDIEIISKVKIFPKVVQALEDVTFFLEIKSSRHSYRDI